jgi:phage gp36-like protein
MITNDDLLKEVSFESLTQLSDLNATGFLDQGVIDDAIDDSISLLEFYIKEIPAEPTHLVRKVLSELTIMELKKKNNLPIDKEQIVRIDKLLEKMGKEKASLNQVTKDNTKSYSFAFKQRKKRVYNDTI